MMVPYFSVASQIEKEIEVTKAVTDQLESLITCVWSFYNAIIGDVQARER